MDLKKVKDVKARPEAPDGSCHFFVERKRRYCRFTPAKGSNYCAEHATIYDASLGRKRVQCPYEPKHTCYAEKLNHHMKKCPSRPREMPAYYSAGINSGDDAGEVVPEPKVTVVNVEIEELESIIKKVNRLYEEHVGEVVMEVLTHSCMKQEVENSSYGTAAIRHRKQQASLIGQMEKLGLLTDNRCFLEMGAGKGQLSHWLHGAVEKNKQIGFVLIDRSHVRNKMDNLHKEEMIMERIRIDIEHLRLDKIPSIEQNNRSILAYGKHLCGPATDLALRCVTETLGSRNPAQDRPEGESETKRLKTDSTTLSGVVIALCCHHRCTWRPYVGKAFFQSCGLGARDFQLISSMSSWATCAWKGWSFQRKVEKHMDNADTSEINIDVKETHQDETVTNDTMPVDESKGRIVTNDSETHVKHPGVGQSEVSVGENKGVIRSESVQDSDGAQSGAVTGKKLELEDEEEHALDDSVTNTGINSKLTQEEREVIGRKCKRLIDIGRVRYLQGHRMNSTMKTYIEEFYTPENVVLIATDC